MNLFIIGAGFTRAVFDGAPLNRGLLAEVASVRENSACQELLDRFGSSEIEVALTKFDAAIAEHPGEQDLQEQRKHINREIALYLAKFNMTQEAYADRPWLRRFAQEVVSPGDTLVNLNYDCVLEGVLDCGRVWTPNGGYGSLTNPLVADRPASRVAVLKIHGSVSFVAAPMGAGESVNFRVDSTLFPISGADTFFGYGAGQGHPYVIAPSFLKVPNVEISYLMLDALAAAKEASHLIVIGCSMRPEDSFLTVLMTAFLRQPDWAKRLLMIVDPNAEEIAARLRAYWTVSIPICPIAYAVDASLDKLVALARQDAGGGQNGAHDPVV